MHGTLTWVDPVITLNQEAMHFNLHVKEETKAFRLKCLFQDHPQRYEKINPLIFILI